MNYLFGPKFTYFPFVIKESDLFTISYQKFACVI